MLLSIRLYIRLSFSGNISLSCMCTFSGCLLPTKLTCDFCLILPFSLFLPLILYIHLLLQSAVLFDMSCILFAICFTYILGSYTEVDKFCFPPDPFPTLPHLDVCPWRQTCVDCFGRILATWHLVVFLQLEVGGVTRVWTGRICSPLSLPSSLPILTWRSQLLSGGPLYSSVSLGSCNSSFPLLFQTQGWKHTPLLLAWEDCIVSCWFS